MSLNSDCKINNDNNNNNNDDNRNNANWQTYHGGPANLDLRLADIIRDMEPLAPVIMRLKASVCPGIKRISEDIDYPEVICTKNLKGSIYDWQKTTLDNKLTPELLKPLRRLIESIHRVLGGTKEGKKKVKLTTPERNDLGVLRTRYEEFINDLIETEGKQRLQLLKGRPRLYGLEQVLIIPLSKAHKIVSINKYNQVINKNTYGAGNVYWEGGVHFKRAPDDCPMFPGLEWAVIFFGKRLFDQKTTDTKLVKIVGVWVRNAEALCSYGSKGRRELTLFQTGKKVDEKHNVVKFFHDNPKIKKKYLFKEERKTYLMQISRSIEGDNLFDYIANKAYLKITNLSTSINFVQAFALRRSDDRADNFIVDRDDHVIGIDNDRAHGPPVWIEGGKLYLNVRSILLLFPEWNNRSLDSYVSKKLQKLNPGHFILGWLGALHSQNKKYAALQKTGSFTEHDYNKLSLPITLPPSSINETYRLLVKLKKVTHDESKSRWEIFKAVYPPIAALYEQVLIKSENDPIAAQNLLFQRGLCRIDLLMEEIKDDKFDPDNPSEIQLFADLKALALPEDEPSLTRTKLEEKIGFLTPLKLAQKWLSAFPLSDCTEDEQIDLINAALNAFPEWEALTLSQNTLEKKSLVDLADKKKQLKSLTLVSSRSPVSTGMVLELMEMGVSVHLTDTVLEDQNPENIELIVKFTKLRGDKVKFTTTKTPSSTIKVPFLVSEDSQEANRVKQQPKPITNTLLLSTLIHTERALLLKSSSDLSKLSSAFQVKVSTDFANDKNLIRQLAEQLPTCTFRLLDLSKTDINDDDLELLIKNMPDDPIYFVLSGCKQLSEEALRLLSDTYYSSALGKKNAHGQLCLGHIYFNGLHLENSTKTTEENVKKMSEEELDKWKKELPEKRKKDDKMAAYLYRLAATQKLAEAQCYMGNCYRTGRGVEGKDLQKAVQFYGLAAEQNNSEAIYQLSMCHRLGKGVAEPSIDKAINYLHQAATLGNIDAMLRLARCYEYGDDVHQNSEMACRLYEHAYEQGGDDAEQTLSEFRKRNSLSPRRLKNSTCMSPYKFFNEWSDASPPNTWKKRLSLTLLKPKAVFMLESAKDLNQLQGVCRIKIGKKFAKNIDLIQQLANQLPDTLSELDLSNTNITDNGLGLLVKAMSQASIFFNLIDCPCLTTDGLAPLIEIYTQSAVDGTPLAWVWAGHIHLKCGDKGQRTARLFYQKAADLKDSEGQYYLANCYANGIGGVGQDLKKAANLYKKAAWEGGHTEALYCLGKLHHHGNGVDKSIENALVWYLLAAHEGHPDAHSALKDIYLNNEDATRQNLQEIEQFFQDAAKQGVEGAEEILSQIKAKKRRPSLIRSFSDILNNTSNTKFSTIVSGSPRRAKGIKKIVLDDSSTEEFIPQSLTPECVFILRRSDQINDLNGVFKVKVSKTFAKDAKRIKKLAENLPSSLRELDLSNTKITRASLNLLVKNMPENPIYFNIMGCNSISKKSLIQVYKKAARKGNASGQRCYGLLFLRGIIDKPHPEKAREYFNKAAGRGDVWALDLIGECYSQQSDKDLYEANCFYEKAAEKEFASGQYHLAENLWDKIGFDKKNRKKAFSLYSLAAEQGYAPAQYKLALCYMEGEVCNKNEREAKKLLKCAARQSNEDAKNTLKARFACSV